MTHSDKEFQDFAENLARNAGKILLDLQQKTRVVKQKDIQDIATTADLASEKYIIGEIAKEYPGHSILSEEQGETDKNSDFRWIIDPLDGTKEYVRNIPLWNCSLALQFKNETVASAVYRPQENTLYSAAKGLGSFRNNKKISVSKITELGKSFVYCYIPSYKRQQDKYDHAFEKLKQVGKKVYRLRALCDVNTALSWVAQGGCEAFINLSNPEKPHDIIPGLLIAKEAGAVIDTEKYPVVVCNNQKIYSELSKII